MFDNFVGHPENLTASARERYGIPLHGGATRTMHYFTQNIRALPENIPRYQAAFKRLDVPAMMIWGKADLALDYEVMTGQFARDLNIPPDHIRVFEDAKYFLWEDYSREIAQPIADFAR